MGTNLTPQEEKRKTSSKSKEKRTNTSRLLAVYGRIQQLRYFGTNSPADMLISSVRSTSLKRDVSKWGQNVKVFTFAILWSIGGQP
jgi:hypothetical protein